MAEIHEAGYQHLRDHIESASGYAYVELQEVDGTPWERLEIDTDARCNWTHDANAQTLELTVVISGDDADVTLPQEFGKSVLFDGATGGDPLSTETITKATLEAADDEVTIKHQVEVPEVV